MQELSYEWMLRSRSLMLKKGKWQDSFFFSPVLDILSSQQAQPSNVLREVKTSLSVFFMRVCERNLSSWSCTGIDTINLNGSFTTVRVFCKHMLSCQPTSFKAGCWAQQMVYPADTHATNSYFNTQLCCLNEATAAYKVLKLPITGNSGGGSMGWEGKAAKRRRPGLIGMDILEAVVAPWCVVNMSPAMQCLLPNGNHGTAELC